MNIIIPKQRTSEIEASIIPTIKGEYQIQVVHPNGEISYPIGKEFHKNVITNYGLARILTGEAACDSDYGDRVIPNAIAFLRVGSGTTAATENDTTLENQLTNPAPSSTFFTGTGANVTVGLDTASVTGQVTHKFTKQLPAVTGDDAVTINEIGLGYGDTDASLFSRFVTPAPIVLQKDQILRVSYQITISLPQFATPTIIDSIAPSNGFDISGTLSAIGSATDVFGQVRSGNTGIGIYDCGIYTLIKQFRTNYSPTYASMLVLAKNDGSSVATLDNPSVRTPNTSVLPYYVDGLFEFGPSSPPNNVSDIRKIILAYKYGYYSEFKPVWQILLNSDQEKLNTHRLRIGIRTGWARA